MTNIITRKLCDHASAAAKVRIYEDENGTRSRIELISYSTMVCAMEFRDDANYVECTGTYSATTRKHIGWFVREYMPTFMHYSTFRDIVGKGFCVVDYDNCTVKA